MKKLLFATALLAAFSSRAQTTYFPVTLTGFNADVVANGTGAASTSTTADVDNQNYAFVTQNFVNAAAQTPSTYLPANGTINSAMTTTPGLSFQLAPYTGNNSLRIRGIGNGTLTFSTPQTANKVYVLATAGSGETAGCTTTMTVNFTDATTQVFTGINVKDWTVGTTYAISGISNVNRSTDAIGNPLINPKLYQFLLTLSAANASKTIQSISFNVTAVGGTNTTLNVMGVTIEPGAPTLATDAGIVAATNPNSGCILTNTETITVTVRNHGSTPLSNIPVSYTIGSGAPVNEVVPGPIPANSTATYSFTAKANFSTAGTYNLSIRTNLTGDLAPANDVLTKTITLAAAPAAATIAASGSTTICTGGSVTLTASTPTSGVTYQWFKDGVAISNAFSASYIANAAGSYTVTALASGCAGPTSAATAISMNTAPIAPAVIAGGPLAICANGSVTLTAASVTGATFTWFKGGTVIPGATSATYTATTAGSYTATATLNGCSGPASTASVVTTKTTPSAPSISQSGLVLTSSSTANNQWYLNGVLIQGATGRTFTPTTNGAYTVVVTSNGCSSLPSAAVNITSLGLGDEVNGLDVKVYPNPSNGLFIITLPQAKNYEMSVTDLTGKVVKQLTVKNTDTQLDISDASKGIYFLKIVSEDKTAIRKLIVE